MFQHMSSIIQGVIQCWMNRVRVYIKTKFPMIISLYLFNGISYLGTIIICLFVGSSKPDVFEHQFLRYLMSDLVRSKKLS